MTDRQAAEDSTHSQTSGSERRKRTAELDEVQPSGSNRKSAEPTPDEPRALIDDVFRSYDLDFREATDAYGWRCLTMGSAQGSNELLGPGFAVLFFARRLDASREDC